TTRLDERPASLTCSGQACPRHTVPWLYQLFVLSAIILLIGGGAALLWETQHVGGSATAVHAAGDVSVSGQPTLSAATIDAIFVRLGSPMVGTGKLVEQTSRQTNIDDAFALAVWWTETNDGAAGVGLADRNPGSVRGSVGYPSAFDGYTIYPSYSAAVVYWFNMLRNNYVNRGLGTVYAIARPYVGTSSYPLWAGKVIALMYNYRGIAPPPPVSTPKPKPTVDPKIVAAKNARIRKFTPWLQFLLSHNVSTLAIARGQTQEINTIKISGTQPTNSTPALPFGANLAIVLFGLLTAVAIAFYAYKLPGGQSQQSLSSLSSPDGLLTNQPQESQMSVPSTSPSLPEHPETAYAPSPHSSHITDAPIAPKQIAPAPAFTLPTRSRPANAISRRITLLPSSKEAQM
ncbi:MAG TPA: hypothetical protein VIY29_18125, partial [Ktedonobacteraceae bacterium]